MFPVLQPESPQAQAIFDLFMWVLLISWAALRGGGLPRLLNYFGLLVSLAGVITIVPGLSDVGAIFGLGSIVWFAWVGIVLLRSRSNAAA